jgi:hypothetical protein
MMENLLWVCAGILVCLVLLRFRDRIFSSLRQFDEDNVKRIARQQQDLSDPAAHFRHTLEVADEQVEQVEEIVIADSRTGLPMTHYLFEAQVFPSRDEAEQMRGQRVAVVARRFYQELPEALTASSSAASRGKLSARERAAQRWRKTLH